MQRFVSGFWFGFSRSKAALSTFPRFRAPSSLVSPRDGSDLHPGAYERLGATLLRERKDANETAKSWRDQEEKPSSITWPRLALGRKLRQEEEEDFFLFLSSSYSSSSSSSSSSSRPLSFLSSFQTQNFQSSPRHLLHPSSSDIKQGEEHRHRRSLLPPPPTTRTTTKPLRQPTSSPQTPCLPTTLPSPRCSRTR